jgi:hypothetical protein
MRGAVPSPERRLEFRHRNRQVQFLASGLRVDAQQFTGEAHHESGAQFGDAGSGGPGRGGRGVHERICFDHGPHPAQDS